MAGISKRFNKDGSVSWLAQIRVPGTKPINRCFKGEDLARAFIAAEEPRLRKRVDNRGVPDSRSFYKERFRDTIAIFLAEAKPTRRQEMHLRTIAKHVGEICLGDIRRSFLKDYAERVMKKDTRRACPPTSTLQH